MSRPIIGAIVGIAIAVLTAVCYVVASGGLAERVKADARLHMNEARVPRQAQNNARLDLLNTQGQVENLAKDEGVVAALRTTVGVDRVRESDLAFGRFKNRIAGDTQPDVLALVDAKGQIVVMDGVNNPVASELLDKSGKPIWRGLDLAVHGDPGRPGVAEIWNYPGRGLTRMGVAPVVDRETADGTPKVIGAAMIGYAQSSKLAREEQGLLGVEIAYFSSDGSGDKVFTSSFRKGDGSEDAHMQEVIAPLLKRSEVKAALESKAGIVAPVEASVAGKTYLISAVRMPRYPVAKALPDDYPPVTAGALLLAPAGRHVPEHSTAARMILVLGAIALVLALGAMWLSSRRILDQVDELEVGVAEIINGNLERTFRPVGADLDGLANGLNVMLARLLGRPEPGEEEMDDDGNPIVPGRVEFEEDDAAAPPPDSSSAELANLAREPEPDYYKRVYTEYVDARRATGSPDEVSFEGFIAKLRVNEGKLKATHQCKAVRFRVVTKDGKVTLKPVPIF
jgi:hypothetical protein